MMLFVLCFSCLLFAEKLSAWDNQHTIDGQVFYQYGSSVSIPSNSYLLVEIEDSTVKSRLTRAFAIYVNRARIFPVTFNISYVVPNVVYGHAYTINAKIINRFHDVLFQNERIIEVKLLGRGRTRFIDIPVGTIQRML